MPCYDYTCPSCGWEGERIVPMRAADNQCCSAPVGDPPVECLASLQRVEVSLPQGGPAVRGMQQGAVMADGSFVPGHFGKSAAKRRQWL